MSVSPSHNEGIEKLVSTTQPIAHWGAVLAMSLCTFTLIASEFMPVSLLTPIATDLAVSQGQAGQAIAISGVFAVLTSLFVFKLIGRMDRKVFLLLMSAIMALSGLIVSFAPDYVSFMVGRALIGAVIGGFWSFSAAIMMRLVPEPQVPRAMAILNGGNALATIIAAPLGSFLGEWIGWRGAFFTVVPMAVIVFFWQWGSLPKMPARHQRDLWHVFRLLRRPLVILGILTIATLFMGQFALFTYVRPFLEQVTGVTASILSFVLLIIGLGGFIGNILIGFLLHGHGLFKIMIALPFCMALIAVGLLLFGYDLTATALLLGAWGMIGTALPVCYWSWLARYLAQDAEPAGGLMVAVIQAAITLGASLGGILFDASGYQSTFIFAVILLLSSSFFAYLTAHITHSSDKNTRDIASEPL